ncbi:hypothetical protein NC651_027026 [Populus alba x Populus x berolinensis]|nr:hypothetical protein NC651_027026 [Populus alba x Populus x berolinensis]
MREKGSPAPSGHNGGLFGCSKSIPLVSAPKSKGPGAAHLCRPSPSLGDIASTSYTDPSLLCPGISPSPARATLVSPVIGTPLTGRSTNSPVTQSLGSLSSSLVHFPAYSSYASCHLQESDVRDFDVHWKHCLIGFVAGKCPGYAALLSYINRTWQHRATFTMHDSSWLIFTFSFESEMLDVLGAGPYVVFGRPLILKIMPTFFYFQFTELSSMPTWVRFPNLPFRCWNHL